MSLPTGQKSKGGRGLRSENKYERLTVSLHPQVAQLLRDYAAAHEVSVSEQLSTIIHHYSRFRPLRERKKALIPLHGKLDGETK